MKRLLSLLVLIMFCVMGAIAKGDKVPKYDITGAGSGTEGTLLVKVYVYKNKVADEDFKLAAVHGVCSAFFTTDGDCQKYASVIAGSYDRVKTAKGLKMGAIVQVDKASLRKALEKAGVVRSLSSGF